MTFVTDSTYIRRQTEPGICDFVFGNPQEMPLPGLVAALERALVPTDKDHFAYKNNEPAAQEVVATSLRARTGIAFEPADVFLTPGTFGALSVAMRAIVDPGDEVIFLSPPWFFYEPMIQVAGGVPVRVTMPAPFDLPIEAIAAAITERTRAIIVNSPHNPTGRILPRAHLDALAAVLAAAELRNDRPLWLLSDESHNRVVFDGRVFTTPAAVYPRTMVLHTYGKTLLAPGERIGYIALPPTDARAEREALRGVIFMAQVAGGWQFPNATLQRAIGDLEQLSIDIPALQGRRDRMASALTDIGYDVIVPESTFYMMVRSPMSDDVAFTEMLTEYDVFVGPGAIFEMPGYLRISLTANDDMITRSIPAFAKAFERARTP